MRWISLPKCRFQTGMNTLLILRFLFSIDLHVKKGMMESGDYQNRNL
jgi:hypothetical protein